MDKTTEPTPLLTPSGAAELSDSRQANDPSEIHDSEWETVSESDSLDRPLLKAELHRLTEIPMRVLTESDSIKWFAPVLNYKNDNKCYELIMVKTEPIYTKS